MCLSFFGEAEERAQKWPVRSLETPRAGSDEVGGAGEGPGVPRASTLSLAPGLLLFVILEFLLFCVGPQTLILGKCFFPPDLCLFALGPANHTAASVGQDGECGVVGHDCAGFWRD